MPEPPTTSYRADQQTNSRKNGCDPMTIWTAVVGVFTGLLFIANAIGLFFIEEQWRFAGNSQRDTHEQLRAFMTITGWVPGTGINIKTGLVGPSFSVQVQNLGGTRTGKARGWISIHFFDQTIPNNFDPTKPYDEINPPPDVVVAPNGILPMPPVGISDEEAQKAIDGKGVIIMWGHVEYTTIYDKNTILPLSFCYVMNPTKADLSKIVSKSTNGIQPVLPVNRFMAEPYKSECNYGK